MANKLHFGRSSWMHPLHGPQRWPWWRPVSLSLVRLRCQPPWDGYALWIYTRWGAMALDVYLEKGAMTRG